MYRTRFETTLKIVILTFAILVSAAAVYRAATPEGEASWEEEIQAWIEWRDARLRSPDYYLSIVGLYLLEEGANTFGSDPANDIVFPKKAPRTIGTVNLKDGVATVEVSPGVRVESSDRRVTSLELLNDHEEEGPTLLELGTFTWFVIKRGDRMYLRLKDTESALLRGFRGVERFPTSKSWRFDATVEWYRPDKYTRVQNTLDMVENRRVHGAVVFEMDGKTYRLDALEEMGTDLWFIAFADETSAVETYGGGRYIYIDPPDEQGRTVLDFNKAYNPPCAFNDKTTCPLPPPQNILPIRVTAGELVYKKQKAHK